MASWSTVTLRPRLCSSPRITESLRHFSCRARPSALSFDTSFHPVRPGNSMKSQMRQRMMVRMAQMASRSSHQPCHMPSPAFFFDWVGAVSRRFCGRSTTHNAWTARDSPLSKTHSSHSHILNFSNVVKSLIHLHFAASSTFNLKFHIVCFR